VDKLFAHWSPDASRLVFSQNDPDLGIGRIATMRSDGVGTSVILTGEIPWDCYQPEFSPDGKDIVFASQSEGLTSALWIMGTNGAHKRRLTTAELEAGAPTLRQTANISFSIRSRTPHVRPASTR
jgi:Tol biopolymer transport system component